jgi:hypothetical protein
MDFAYFGKSQSVRNITILETNITALLKGAPRRKYAQLRFSLSKAGCGMQLDEIAKARPGPSEFSSIITGTGVSASRLPQYLESGQRMEHHPTILGANGSNGNVGGLLSAVDYRPSGSLPFNDYDTSMGP